MYEITVTCNNMKKKMDYGYNHRISFDPSHVAYIVSRYGLNPLDFSEKSDGLYFSKAEIRNPSDLDFAIAIRGNTEVLSDFLKNPFEAQIIEHGIQIDIL